jgi:hypothetical protein
MCPGVLAVIRRSPCFQACTLYSKDREVDRDRRSLANGLRWCDCASAVQIEKEKTDEDAPQMQRKRFRVTEE